MFGNATNAEALNIASTAYSIFNRINTTFSDCDLIDLPERIELALDILLGLGLVELEYKLALTIHASDETIEFDFRLRGFLQTENRCELLLDEIDRTHGKLDFDRPTYGTYESNLLAKRARVTIRGEAIQRKRATREVFQQELVSLRGRRRPEPLLLSHITMTSVAKPGRDRPSTEPSLGGDPKQAEAVEITISDESRDASGAQARHVEPSPIVHEQISPEGRAVAILYSHFTKSGKLMTMPALSTLTGMSRSKLYLLQAVKDARAAISKNLCGKKPAKGFVRKNGGVEASYEAEMPDLD